MKIAKCRRCGDPQDFTTKKPLCKPCGDWFDQRWPDGFTPMDEAEPWMVEMAERNFAMAELVWERLFTTCRDHLYVDGHGDCARYCVGEDVADVLKTLDVDACRMVLMAAARAVGYELYRNDKVD